MYTGMYKTNYLEREDENNTNKILKISSLFHNILPSHTSSFNVTRSFLLNQSNIQNFLFPKPADKIKLLLLQQVIPQS